MAQLSAAVIARKPRAAVMPAQAPLRSTRDTAVAGHAMSQRAGVRRDVMPYSSYDCHTDLSP